MADNTYGVGQSMMRAVGNSPNGFGENAAWKPIMEPSAQQLHSEPGSARLVIDTGLDADAGAGAPPASAGSEGASRPDGQVLGSGGGSRPPLPPGQSPAHGVRRISTWLASASAASPGVNRRARLHQEYQQLMREHQTERASAEEIQSRLSSEMRELRDQCHDQGQTVGMLTQRLADARDAVTAELRAATTVRAALGGELMSEESQRRALEAARRSEECEVEIRIETSERQLEMMRRVREALESQLRSSLEAQDELREHIAAERGGCSELQVAGERELVAWNAYNSRVQSELSSRLQVEREEVETMRSVAAREMGHLELENEQQCREESALLAQLSGVREAQEEARSQLQTEEVAWSQEGERLRERLREADEECRQRLDAVRRCRTAVGACGCERAELEEEFEQSAEEAQASSAEIERLEERSEGLVEELAHLQEAARRCREDDEAVRLQKERDMLLGQFRQEAELRAIFESELEALKRSRGILCWRRRPPAPPAAPLPPPSGPPPSALRPFPEGGQRPPPGKGSGRGASPGGPGGGDRRDPEIGGASSSSSGGFGGTGGMRDEV